MWRIIAILFCILAVAPSGADAGSDLFQQGTDDAIKNVFAALGVAADAPEKVERAAATTVVTTTNAFFPWWSAVALPICVLISLTGLFLLNKGLDRQDKGTNNLLPLLLGSALAVAGLIAMGLVFNIAAESTSVYANFKHGTVGIAITPIIIFFLACLCAAAGTGGGGLYTATLILVGGVTVHQAIPLSYAAVFGVGCGSFAFLVLSRHPQANRPLIDYLLCLILEPLTLLGAVFGVFLNLTFPAFILVVLLSVVLGISAWRTIVKGLQLNAKERGQDGIEVPYVFASEQQGAAPNGQVEAMLEKESKFPWTYFVALLAVWVGVCVLVLLRGGDSAHPSVINVSCGTWQYWTLVAATVVFLLAVSALVILHVSRLHRRKMAAGFPFLASDMQWSTRNLVTWPLASIFVGFCASFVGISGGMLQGPLLLEMGILPQVTAATTSFMVLFTSSSVSFQFLVFGLLDWRVGVWFFMVGLVAAFFGQVLLELVMKRHRKQSWIAFLLAGLIIASAVSMISVESARIAQGALNTSFGTVCSPAK